MVCKLRGWLVDCFLSIWGVQKIVSFWQTWKVNWVIAGTVQVSKAVVIASLLQSCFIYVYSSFLIVVAVLSQTYIGAESCYFVPLEICRGKEERKKLEKCADFLVVPVMDGQTKTVIGLQAFIR